MTKQHLTQDGHLETRTSRTKDYTHVVVGHGTPYGCEAGYYVLRWSESEANATRSLNAREFQGYTDRHVEEINGGVR